METDVRPVRLEVIDTNPRARALFERRGFVAGKTGSPGPLWLNFGLEHATTLHFTLPADAG